MEVGKENEENILQEDSWKFDGTSSYDRCKSDISQFKGMSKQILDHKGPSS